MATYTSYDEVGVKEDVSDVITNISPTKTPFLSSIKSEKVTQKRHDWQEDSLADPADNAQVEGFDATDATLTPTTLRSNYTQIFSKTIKVSGSADSTEAHGRAKETAYQMAKKSQEIKRDLERALVGKNQAFVVGNDTTARQMASAFAMIDASNVITTAPSGPFTEANYLLALENLYTAGSEASLLLIKPADSIIVSNFAEAAGRFRHIDGADKKTIVNVVNLYVSPFGEQKVVLDRFLLTTNALAYDPSYWKLLTFRAWFRETLAKTGDSTKMMLVGEYSLKHTNFKASATVGGLT